MPNIGPMELVIILIIALVVFGPKRLPELGRSLGSGMKEFKDSVTGKGESREEKKEPRRAESKSASRPEPPELPAASEPRPVEDAETVEDDEAIAGRSS